MSRYIRKISELFFESNSDREAFEDALASPKSRPQGVLWIRDRNRDLKLDCADALSWQPEFVDRSSTQKLGSNPLHEQGDFYLLDMSSVFCGSAFAGKVDSGSIVLDMCAAPGGKAILAHRILSPSILFCNEAIGNRLPMLISNLKRCRIAPVRVSSCDPKVVAARAPMVADVVIVDAPCSGQALVARGEGEAGCFHPTVVRRNAMRQRRILALAAQVVHPGGILAYMTCTYSPEENEEVVEWFLSKHQDFTSESVDALAAYQSRITSHHLYRMWPHHGIGSGGSVSILRRKDSAPSLSRSVNLPIAWRSTE